MCLSTPEVWMGKTGDGKGGVWNWWVTLQRGNFSMECLGESFWSAQL